MTTRRQLLAALCIAGLLMLWQPGWTQAAEDDTSVVRITWEQLVFIPVQNRLQVIEMVTIQNQGKKAVPKLSFTLPQGVQLAKVISGGDAVRGGDNGVVDTQALKPGQSRDLSWSYTVPISDKSGQLTLDQPYRADQIQLLVPFGYLSVKAVGFLPQSQVVNVGGQKFRQFTRFDLQPDTPWVMAFRQLDPKSGEQYTKMETVTKDGLPILGHSHGMDTRKAVISLTMVVLILLFGYIGVRNANRRTALQLKQYTRRDLEKRRDNLQHQLARLCLDQKHNGLEAEDFKSAQAELERELTTIYYMLKTSEQSA